MACMGCTRLGASPYQVNVTPAGYVAPTFQTNPGYVAPVQPGQLLTCPDGTQVPMGIPCPDATPWYQTPIGILGIIAALVGGGYYFHKRKAAR